MNKNPIFAILWLLLLFFIAWPVAGFCAGIWILLQVRPSHPKKSNRSSIIERLCVVHIRSFLSCPQMLTLALALVLFPHYSTTLNHALLQQPFEACFNFVKQITAFLEKLITWPRMCGVAVMDCQQSFPSPM
jgi:hypothetical protein